MRCGVRRAVRILLGAVLSLPMLVGCRGAENEESPEAAPASRFANDRPPYVRPEGVVFHIPAMLGMRYTEFKGSELEAYLGELVKTDKLPGIRGESYRYGQGELLVLQDRIYSVVYQFPKPVTRLEALHLCGLPESIERDFFSTSMEQRLERSAYGYRRMVLRRVEPESDHFSEIQAWKFLPQERF